METEFHFLFRIWVIVTNFLHPNYIMYLYINDHIFSIAYPTSGMIVLFLSNGVEGFEKSEPRTKGWKSWNPFSLEIVSKSRKFAYKLELSEGMQLTTGLTAAVVPNEVLSWKRSRTSQGKERVGKRGWWWWLVQEMVNTTRVYVYVCSGVENLDAWPETVEGKTKVDGGK